VSPASKRFRWFVEEVGLTRARSLVCSRRKAAEALALKRRWEGQSAARNMGTNY
jgi:hypothetical protein